MGLFSFFRSGKTKEMLKNGAVVIDVRTPQEYDRGRVPGSLNIPVDRMAINIQRIKGMNRPVVLCCATGMRSRTAASILKNAGIKEVHSAGSWEKVLKIMKSV